MKLNLFNYHLPKELIAQTPIKPRDHSRLMVLDTKTKKIKHDYFYNLDKYLSENDVLVFNDSKVFPARLKFDGGIEVFLLRELGIGEWEVMGKKLKKLREIKEINKKYNLQCQVVNKLKNGNWVAKFNYSGKKFRNILEKIGETPLPPYIKTKDSKKIRKDYQTLYADKEGSVAVPTAGLHFTKTVLNKLEKKGVKLEFITLHVGLGTFQPVKTDNIEQHQIHAEYAVLDKAVAKRLNQYKCEGKRIIAVGTTACRVLESLSNQKGQLEAGHKWTNIFIYPPYKFKFIDGMVTNFHLPKSTLLMLVSALSGRIFILKAYQEAIRRKYRFYSFGDGMFISSPKFSTPL